MEGSRTVWKVHVHVVVAEKAAALWRGVKLGECARHWLVLVLFDEWCENIEKRNAPIIWEFYDDTLRWSEQRRYL